MFVKYIATQPILYLCERSVQRPEDWVSWRWWEQEVIGIEGGKGESDSRSGWRGGEMRRGSGTGGHSGPGLKAGNTTVVN